MNRLIKGALAAGTGVVLLLGGAGTLAYWNAETSVDGGTITAGNLTLTNSGSPAWTDQTGTSIDIATFRVVPGDTLTLTQAVTFSATGNNLVGTLSLAGGGVSGDLSAFLSAPGVTMTVPATPGVTCSGATCTVTPGAATVSQTVTVKVAIPFPKTSSPTDQNGAMQKTASLANLTIRLEQNH
jgi:alternate signal-mediated exported protein